VKRREFFKKTGLAAAAVGLEGIQSIKADISGQSVVKQKENDKKNILAGVNYFPGWWEALPNKWHRSSHDKEQGEDWRSDFPERVPLLGCYNTQETMDKEIAAASTYGVDFFAMLWYYNEPGREREPNSRFLENGLRYFPARPEGRNQKEIEFTL